MARLARYKGQKALNLSLKPFLVLSPSYQTPLNTRIYHNGEYIIDGAWGINFGGEGIIRARLLWFCCTA